MQPNERHFHGSGRRLWPRARGEAPLAIAMVLPLFLWLLGTILLPLLFAIRMSFFDVGIIGTGGAFVGLANYAHLLSSRPFWEAMGLSVKWSVASLGLQMTASFGAALILHQRFRGQGFARVWIIVPWIVPTVVTVIMWRWMLGTSGGIVNYLLQALGLISSQVGFFGTRQLAFASVVFINSWRMFPLTGVMLLAAMQSIPEELYEAARVDGASAVQRTLHITLPGLRPVLFALGLINTLWLVNLFDVIWLLTGGGPGTATTTAPVYIYDVAFNAYRLSRASAASVLFGLGLMVFVFVYYRLLGGVMEEEA